MKQKEIQFSIFTVRDQNTELYFPFDPMTTGT